MIKQAFTILILMNLACFINANEYTLAQSGNQYLKMEYMTPISDEALRVKFEIKLDQQIQQWKGAGFICFNTLEEHSAIQPGDPAFGVLFACFVEGGCGGYQVQTWL